jgi:predicted AAA+ superfamily ATPase
MSANLTKSQEISFSRISKLVSEFVPRPNYILTGDVGVGKTTLAKYIAESLQGKYISFVKEYGDDFISSVDYSDIDSSDLLIYLNKNIINRVNSDLIIIDGIEFILNKLNQQDKIEKFISLFYRMTYSKKVILIVSKMYLPSLVLTSDQLVEICWSEEDKELLSHKYNIPKALSHNYINGYYFD